MQLNALDSTSDKQPVDQIVLPLWLTRPVRAFGGLALLLICLGVGLALATWNVADPSWSHATDAGARNILGYPGAALADLLMQFFGLGAISILVPLFVWGWAGLLGRRLDRKGRRFLFAVAGLVLSSAAVATLPLTPTWPLPTAMGGVTGDALLALPALLLGSVSGLAAVIIGGAIALVAAYAIGQAARFEILPAGSDDYDELLDEEEAEEDNDRRGLSSLFSWLSLGALTHHWLHWRTRLGFQRQRTPVSPVELPEAPAKPSLVRRLAHQLFADEEQLTDYRRLDRAEPGFDAPEYAEPAFAEEPAPWQTDQASPVLAVDEEFEPEWDAYEEELEPAQMEIEPQPARHIEPVKTRPAPVRKAPAKRARGRFQLPALDFLASPTVQKANPALTRDALEQNASALEGVLEDFGVRGEIVNVRPGPVVTLYELEPAPGIKSSRVIGLADDIARSMSAISARVAVIPGKNAIGIELPNSDRETVFLRELLAAKDFSKTKAKLAMCLGKTIGGEPVIADLARMPHLLVAGTTGSGKSVSINTMILSILYRLSPEQCRLIMIDPKMLELSVYDGIPHLLTPVVTDPKKAVVALKWTVREMEDRYKKMSKLGVRNIDGFNARVADAKKRGECITRSVQTGFDHETGEPIFEQEELELEPLPFIVVIVDEMADLMMVAGKDIEGAIQRLAQMARAAGIHVILATQRPSVDVITGTIKANFPTRISFQVTSKIDSRTILGEQGAEQLLGMGDMLYMAGGGRIQRVHGPFVADDEVEQIVAHLKTQGHPEYLEAITEETEESVYESPSGGDESNDLYDKAVNVVLRDRKASTSYIQRRLSIGYNRAASLIERMEEEGVVGPANHAGKRDILVGEDPL